MDAVVIILLGLFFCIKSMNAPDTVEEALQEQPTVQLPTKLNESFYQDEHAFEVIINGLDFH